MAIIPLYEPQDERIVISDRNLEDGVAEILDPQRGRAKRVAYLPEFQEQRPNFKASGKNISCRVAEGFGVIPKDYFLGKNKQVLRRLLREGLPLLAPKESVKANADAKWYSPNPQTDSQKLLAMLANGIDIREGDVRNNVISLALEDFLKEQAMYYTNFLYGAEGTPSQRQDRIRRARDYFIEQKPSIKAINLYLPPCESITNTNQSGEENIVGTQIWIGGVDGDFDLFGNDRNLYGANGVAGWR